MEPQDAPAASGEVVDKREISRTATAAEPTGILLVDKPRGPTSHDVVGRVRKLLKTKRVGHCGTLDPMATGVLVVAVGQGTKLVPYLTAASKRYDATIRLGVGTDTLDAEGKTLETASVPEFSQATLNALVQARLGVHLQQVPRVSSVKVDGERLHAKARRGDDFVPPSREVELLSCEAKKRSEGGEVFVDVSMHASKGFYVRSFARDLAADLGTVGHLTALRRTASGSFGLEGAIAITWIPSPDEGASAERDADEGQPASGQPGSGEPRARTKRRAPLPSREVLDAEAAAATAALVPLEDALRSAMPTLELARESAVAVGHGKRLPSKTVGLVALLFESQLIAIGEGDGASIRVRRGFPRES